MKNRVTLLGIGLRRSFWVRFVRKLSEFVAETNLTLEPKSIGGPFFYYEKRCAAKIAEFKPDVILFGDSVRDLLQNDRLLESIRYGKGALSPPPLLFAAVSNAAETFAEYLKGEFVTRAVISDLGVVDRLSADHFATDPNFNTPFHPIEPTPEFLFRKAVEEDFARKLIGRKEISAVTWKSSRFEADAFFKLQSDYLDAAKPPGAPEPTVYLREDQALFVSGVRLSDIVQFRLHGVPVERLIDREEMLSDRILFDSFCRKFRRLLHSRRNSAYLALLRSDPDAIKRNTPVRIHSPHRSVRQVFASLLHRDGFRNILSDRGQIAGDAFPLHLREEKEEAGKSDEKGYSLLFPERIGLEWNVKELDRYVAEHAVDPEKLKGTEDIDYEQSMLRRKIQNLEDRRRLLRSNKAFADRERYQNFVVLRKLDILSSLLERAVVWDEKKNESIEFDEDSALIFYDGMVQGCQIDRQLRGIKKRKLFVDITKKMDGLKRIAKVDTDVYEPFLDSGIVVCSATSRIILSRNIGMYRHYISQDSDRSPSEEEMRLNGQLAKLEKRETELSLLRLYLAAESAYRKYRGPILEAIRDRFQQGQFEKIGAAGIRKVSIAAREKKVGGEIGGAVKRLFKKSYGKEIEIRLAWTDIKLKLEHTKEERRQFARASEDVRERKKRIARDLASQNAAILSTFFNRIIHQIKHFEADLLIVEYEAEAVGVLIRMIRQELPNFASVPVVAIVATESTKESLEELSKLGVRMVSSDRYKMQDGETIGKSIGVHLL